MNITLAIKQAALDAGFDLAGVAHAAASHDLEFARRWVEQGRGGEMHYLANPKRFDPQLVLPSVKSVIGVGLIYSQGIELSGCVAVEPFEEGANSRPGKELATRQDSIASTPISRYAWGRDYHEVMRPKLERLRAEVESLAPGVETRVFVDTGPVVERAFVRLSGLGWMGKNTCIINEDKGSWFFLGMILTNLDLDPDLPAPDRCGSCRRCLDACPTGALVEPYVMDASRCIAYFTIELKGSIPEEYRRAIGNNVFGCDICQDVCPWNNRTSSLLPGPLSQEDGMPIKGELASDQEEVANDKGSGTEFQPLLIDRPDRTWFSLSNGNLADLASLTEDDFRRIFVRSPIKRTKYRGWLRNLCVAMGNSGDTRFVQWLERAREHKDPLVREHAEWALREIEGAKM